MKTLKITLLITAFAFTTSSLFAQSKTKADAQKNPTKVESFAEGRVLTDADLGFLNAITATKGAKSRGAANADVTIDNTTFKVGQTLSAADASKLSSAVASSKKAAAKKKNKDKSRGDCNLWCYYLLQDSYGNWYYYYYCCG